jgi:putative flippase GtrA
MKVVIKEALGYTAVSAVALAVDITVLRVLVHFLSWWYLAAAIASFLSGLAVGYSLCVAFVFRFRRMKDRRIEFLGFAAIGAVGLLINTLVMGFTVKFLGMHYLIAKCAAAGFTFAWNFLSRRTLLFAEASPI